MVEHTPPSTVFYCLHTHAVVGTDRGVFFSTHNHKETTMGKQTTDRTRIQLEQHQMPDAWYNIAADLARLDPPLHPATRQPLTPDDLAALFPPDLIAQEASTQRDIDIPGEVQDIYRMTRPTPLIRAARLERALGTPARIYYKHEGVNPAGSHKTNTAIAQAYYNKKAGVRKLATETGAGQWGSALAFACSLFGLECEVYMVRVSYDQKPYRKTFMNLFGARVLASPSPQTGSGRAALAADPGSPGSLGIAISEAVEAAAADPGTNYALGSVLNHVLLHQTVIGREAQLQLEMAGERPDVIIGCVGGGSNFAGIAFPFLRDKLGGRRPRLRAIAVEPAACASLTSGQYRYDNGDSAGLTPLLKMHTLGRGFVPPAIHAGGLRYHGMAPLVSALYDRGAIEARAYAQDEVFAAAQAFARCEGIVPEPESAHAVAAVLQEGRRCQREGRAEVILFNLSGHGLFDLGAYQAFLDGSLAGERAAVAAAATA